MLPLQLYSCALLLVFIVQWHKLHMLLFVVLDAKSSM